MNNLQTKTSQIPAPLMNGKSSVCQGGDNLDKDVDVKIIKDHWECVADMSRYNFCEYFIFLISFYKSLKFGHPRIILKNNIFHVCLKHLKNYETI